VNKPPGPAQGHNQFGQPQPRPGQPPQPNQSPFSAQPLSSNQPPSSGPPPQSHQPPVPGQNPTLGQPPLQNSGVTQPPLTSPSSPPTRTQPIQSRTAGFHATK
jgi:hypothetical protein